MSEHKPEALEFLDIIKQKIRINIIILLYENVEMSYTDLLNTLNIDEGLLNFHLRKIKKFLKVTEEKTYMLSEYGKIAYEVLYNIDKRTRSLTGNDARLFVNNSGQTSNIIVKRIVAFLLDVLILFLSTGLFLDRNFLAAISDIYMLRLPSISLTQFTYETVAVYSHIFFMGYIMFTVLEAYRGQTLGKYMLGLRVVKIDGRRISLIDSAVRNLGKAFILPLDVLVGVGRHRKDGYIRFLDYYTKCTVEQIVRP